MQTCYRAGWALLLLAVLVPPVFAQPEPVAQVQPSIMVVPFAHEGEDLRTLIEADADVGITLTVVQRAFDARGFTTVDALAYIREMTRDDAMMLGTQESLKQMLIDNAPTEIYLEVRTSVDQTDAGNRAAVQVNAIDTATSGALANDVCRNARPFRTSDLGRLVENALDDCLDNLLDTMMGKFDQVRSSGRSLDITIRFGADSDLDMYTEIGTQGDVIADALEDWMDENAYQNNYRIRGSSDLSLEVDDFRIPLREPGTDRNYRPRTLGRALRRYITNELGIDARMDVQGANVYITLGSWR
ncbi:MAG: DUF6175 family protein [Bacteroidota bacterium]